MTINAHNRLLMTGAAGGLGQAMRDRLKVNCSVLRLSDRAEFGPAQAHEEILLADLADADAVLAMVQGVDAIVHFGGVSVEGPFGPILQANILGAYNLYEAARKHGTKRIVFASSNHVTGYYLQSETITADRPPRPEPQSWPGGHHPAEGPSQRQDGHGGHGLRGHRPAGEGAAGQDHAEDLRHRRHGQGRQHRDPR